MEHFVVLFNLIALVEEEKEWLSYGDLIRLGRVSKIIHTTLLDPHVGLVWASIRDSRLSMHWKQVNVCSDSSEMRAMSSIKSLPWIELCATNWNGVPILIEGRRYLPQRYDVARVATIAKTRLCRECARPTQAVATTTSGTRVRICRACSKDACSYSALCSRKDVHTHNINREWHLKTRLVNAHLASLPVARRGGNRAHLFWRHKAIAF